MKSLHLILICLFFIVFGQENSQNEKNFDFSGLFNLPSILINNLKEGIKKIKEENKIFYEEKKNFF